MQRPNILLLYTDQQRYDALGVNGNADVQTPHLDVLARGGVTFDHCFVQNPVCMPSRVSMLTGQYPSRLGITHMGVPVPENLPLLPHLLAPYGYTTALFGKLHFLPHANRDHRIPHPAYGFDQLEVSDEPGVYEDAYRAWVGAKDSAQLGGLSAGLPPARRVWLDTLGLPDAVAHPTGGPRDDAAAPVPAASDLTHSAFVAERSIDFLRRHAGRQPFLCVASFFSPHAPWRVPQRYLDRYDPKTFSLPRFPAELELERVGRFSDDHLRAARHGYYAMVSEVDDCVGEILGTLAELGLGENTVVLFTSDHGDWLGHHLKFGKGYPGDDHVSRVPLIIRYPQKIAAGGRCSDIVEAVDIVPTLLALAGIQIPPTLQGERLPLEYGSLYSKTSALTEGDGWKALRTKGYRYFIRSDGEEQLFDLRAELGDYHDLSRDAAHQGALAEHRRGLLQRLLALERPLPRTWLY